jgi:hypothetical protein
MKLRVFAILAVALLAGAIGMWFWAGSDVTVPPPPETPEALGNSSVGTPPPVAPGVPTPSVPGTAAVPPSAPAVPAVPPAAAQPAAPVRITSSVVPGMPVVRGGSSPVSAPPVVAPVSKPGPASQPEREGRAEVEAVSYMFRDFRTRMGENPVGSNAEIMQSVMGGNPVKARLGPPEGQSLNEQGELVDKWGTPYFFHQMSKDKMEIRSAGPDMKLWTNDDVVAQ